MKSSIEEYLKINRDDLDIFEPDRQKMWCKIHKECDVVKSPKKMLFALKFVASIAILIMLTFGGAYIYYLESRLDSIFANYSETLELKETKYKNRIKELSKVICKIDKKNKKIDAVTFLYEDLDKIDKVYTKTIGEIYDTGFREETIDIVFDTYEKRLRVLEQIINEYERNKKYENYAHKNH